jgi:ZIP family zinc transporter
LSLSRTLLLGFIAGATILLGLPIGRVRRPAASLRVLLNASAIGILLFLFWDVLAAAWEPVDGALGKLNGTHGLGQATGYGVLFAFGISVGLLSLVAYERWMRNRANSTTAAASSLKFGPGAMSVGELPARTGFASWSAARQLALLIAVGIGLHNFAEGLAIGQSAASGEVQLAVLLVIGFALHNATEGFGICAPLASEAGDGGPTARPSWGFLLALGAVAGGPTFIGTIVGYNFTSEPVSVLFLTLAAGSILYVVMQLMGIAMKSGRRELVAFGVLAGLLAGFLTDAVITAAGV